MKHALLTPFGVREQYSGSGTYFGQGNSGGKTVAALGLDVERRFDISGAMAIKTSSGNGLREDDADRNEDCAGSGSERHGHFDAGTFCVLIAAAETEPALGKVFADSDLLSKAASPYASKDARLDARAIAARYHAVLDARLAGAILRRSHLGNRFDPDGRRIAMAAETRNTLANFKRFQLQLVEIDDFAALAKAAFHEQAGESFLGFVRSREVDVPKIGAWLEKMDGIEKATGILVDFGDDAGARFLPVVAIQVTSQMQLLADIELFRETQNSAIAADEQRLRGLRERGPGRRSPGGFHGNAETHTVTLPESIR